MNGITQDQVSRDRMSYIYRQGYGYSYAGKLGLPSNPIYPKTQCEPDITAQDGSLHFLNPPLGAQPQLMQWHSDQRDWTPLQLGSGKRVGFTSEYLAAYGWAYMGPA